MALLLAASLNAGPAGGAGEIPRFGDETHIRYMVMPRLQVRAMPRDGRPSDVRNPTLSIVCEPCGRRGTYNVTRLIEYGEPSRPICRRRSPIARRRARPASTIVARGCSKGWSYSSENGAKAQKIGLERQALPFLWPQGDSAPLRDRASGSPRRPDVRRARGGGPPQSAAGSPPALPRACRFPFRRERAADAHRLQAAELAGSHRTAPGRVARCKRAQR